jgi:hypothetical protein
MEGIGAILHVRTKDNLDNELGVFTSDTRPTDVEVWELVNQAWYLSTPCIGTDPTLIPDWLGMPVQQALTIRTCMMIELAYWPEQTNNSDSIYARLKEMFDPLMERICKLAAYIGASPAQEAEDALGAGAAQFGFPDYGWIWLPLAGDPAASWVMGNDGSPLWGVTYDDLRRILEYDHR